MDKKYTFRHLRRLANEEVGFVVIEFTSTLKINEIRKELQSKQIIVNSPFIISYLTECRELFKFLHANKQTLTYNTQYQKVEKIPFNYEKFTDYAISKNIENPFTLTYEYSEIYKNSESELHQRFADVHYGNAQVFCSMPDRHRQSVAATKVVTAYITEGIKRTSNTDYLKSQIKGVIDWWDAPATDPVLMDDYIALAELTRRLHGEFTLKNLFTKLFHAFQIGQPKKRWLCLQGRVNAGKTKLAAGIRHLLDGVSINVNISDDSRRSFQLGQAIGKRFVIFDDVTSIGFRMLDQSMREFLDGEHEVSLERKHKNPLQVIFPQGLITTNEEGFPEAIMARVHNFNLTPNESFLKAHEDLLNARFDKTAVVICKYDTYTGNYILRSRKKKKNSFSSFLVCILLGINFDVDSEFKECFIDSVEDRLKSMYSKPYLFLKMCNLF